MNKGIIISLVVIAILVIAIIIISTKDKKEVPPKKAVSTDAAINGKVVTGDSVGIVKDAAVAGDALVQGAGTTTPLQGAR
jgi:uncharacterized Zn ribbon protein